MSSKDSIRAQRESLELRRQQLAERQAARLRANGTDDAALPSCIATPTQPSALKRDNSACMASASKARPLKRRPNQTSDKLDPDVEA